MVIALIVVGVVLFLIFDFFILKRALGGRERAQTHGSFAVPGSLDVTLPAGKTKVTYAESKRASSDEDTIYFSVPDTVTVTVTPAAGGDPLEMKGPGFRGMGSSRSTRKDFSSDLVGSVEITEPGSYTVTAAGEAGPDAVEPRILIGK